MLTLTDVQVGDILVTRNVSDVFFYQIVGYNKSNMPRYVHLESSTKCSNRQVTFQVNLESRSKPVTFIKPLKDGFLRIDKKLVERYDPTKVYSMTWNPVGSQDDSDYCSYVDSDFEN